MKYHQLWTSLLLIFLPLFSTGCSLLIGNVRPVEEKSDKYTISDLAKGSTDWRRIDEPVTNKARTGDSTDVSDMTFQSEKTASIVSLNSACRPTLDEQGEDLKSFTRELLLGISDITQKTERNTTISGTPALETTVQGKLNGQPMKLRTVVLKKSDCVYDLMYIARPHHFDSQVADFDRFVGSLRLK